MATCNKQQRGLLQNTVCQLLSHQLNTQNILEELSSLQTCTGKVPSVNIVGVSNLVPTTWSSCQLSASQCLQRLLTVYQDENSEDQEVCLLSKEINLIVACFIKFVNSLLQVIFHNPHQTDHHSLNNCT